MDTEDINYISHRNSLEFGSAGYCIDFEESEIIERTPPVYQTSAPSNLYMSNLPLDFVERSKFLSESVLALRADISHDYDDVCKIIDSIPKMLLDQKKSEFNCLSYRSTSNLAQNSLIFEQVISKYPNTILYAINLAVFGKKFATNKKPQLIERLLNLYLKLENFNCVYHLNALIFTLFSLSYSSA
jgi:hypothetical protein